MSKAERLEGIAGYTPPAHLAQAVASVKGRVLDFGCGRGELVLWCRERGIDAHGFEPNELYVRNGNVAAEALGHPGVLRTAMTDFEAGSFELVVSNQVLEHVTDLDAAVASIALVTAPGGRGLHVFPSKWRPIESHLDMPFVHWLPPAARKLAIRGFVRMGIRPSRWDATPDELWRYSLDKTRYRSLRSVVATFAAHGIDARPARRGVRLEWLRRLLITVYLETRRLDPGLQQGAGPP